MFTGIVKLAQIDDYITPSQSCVKPKIMKEEELSSKATVTLNDCLACSGCITSAESVLIEEMSIGKFKKEVGEKEDIRVIVAPQVVLALAKYYKLECGQVVAVLNAFFKDELGAKAVYDLEEGIAVCHDLIFEEYSKSENSPVLCSECPGWICYAEKTLTANIVNLLSKVKSPQQILGRIIKEKFKGCYLMSIMPCYDKKLQTIRFDIEEGLKEVDLTITTTELIDLVKSMRGNDDIFANCKLENSIPDRVLKENQEKPLSFLKDQVSNGYIASIMNRLQASEVQITQVRNSDFIEYSFMHGEKKVKMVKCYGFRNIQKVIQQIKKKKCQYKYIEIMACPGGCFSGGGQIRYEGVKAKEISKDINQIAQKTTRSTQKLESISEVIKQEQKTKFMAQYRPIEKTFTASVMNW